MMKHSNKWISCPKSCSNMWVLSSKGSSIGCEPRLMKQMSQVRILLSLSLREHVKKKKKCEFYKSSFIFSYQSQRQYYQEFISKHILNFFQFNFKILKIFNS